MVGWLHDLSWVLPLRSEAMTVLFTGFSALGYLPFYLGLLPLGYWLGRKDTFARLAILILMSAILNAWLKDLFRDPRPDSTFALDPYVSDSYGLPSGHAQVALATWFWLAWEIRRLGFWIFAALLVAGVAFSRLYLGVHDLEDVLAGLAVGAVSVVAFHQLCSERFGFWHALDARAQLGLLLLLQPLLWLAWPADGHLATASGIGAFLVGWWGGVRYDRHRLDYQRHPSRGRAVLASAIGLVLVFAIAGPLEGPLLVLGLGQGPATWLQMLLLGAFITAIAPWLFRHARLSN